jgi:hypothetical protein
MKDHYMIGDMKSVAERQTCAHNVGRETPWEAND